MKMPENLVYSTLPSPWGVLTLAASSSALHGVWFEGQQHRPDMDTWTPSADHPVLELASAQLQAYFDGRLTQFDVPLDLSSGTAFQQKVWQSLLTIETGTTVSYGTVSERIGQPTAVRAVGGAIGRNPIGIIVPCHRVVGANGTLTGYAGGLDRKAALLQLERNP